MKKWILVILFWIFWVIGTLLFFFSGNNKKNSQEKNINIDYKKLAILQQEKNKQNPQREKRENSNKNTILKKKINKTINLVIPNFFYSTGFLQLQNTLQKDNAINLKIIKIKKLDEYLRLIREWSFIKKSNIFLIPYDWKSLISTKPIDLQENILSFFNPITYEALSKRDTIPFWLDPMISFEQGLDNISSLKIQDILNFYKLPLTQEQKKSYYTPLLWFPKEKQNIQLSLAIVSNILQQAKKNKETILLKKIKELTNVNTIQGWYGMEGNWEKLNLLSQSLIKKEIWCNNNKINCLLFHKFWWIKFWFFSEKRARSILNKKNININSFPFYWKEYPIRLWGFIIPDSPINSDEKNIEATNLFFQQFINNFSRKDIPIIPTITNKEYYNTLEKERYWKITILKKYWKILLPQDIENIELLLNY